MAASYSPSTKNGTSYYNDSSVPQPPPLGLQLYVPSYDEREQPEMNPKKRKNRDDDSHEDGAGKEKRPRVNFHVAFFIIITY